MLEFPSGRITFDRIWNSNIPPFIISFLENYIPKHNKSIDKKEFEDLLNKAIIFNINYIIKPKNTLLKFLFGEIETRPVSFIRNRLKYFQFYGYYIIQIEDFIQVNSLEFVSINQIEHLLNDVNRNLYDEISGKPNQAQRMNLVKLLYYFFHDLGDNNPINIKLPKKILSAFFADKGFIEIKKRIDVFFSDEIFIQEAIELMNPDNKKLPRVESESGVSEEQIKHIVSKAKTELINRERSDMEIEKILKADDEQPQKDIETINIKFIREQEAIIPEIEKSRLVVDNEIYTDDLLFASQFNEIAPPVHLTKDEKRKRIIEDLFCENSYRKKIIKKIFDKDEVDFFETVNRILDKKNWDEVVIYIDELFKNKKVNFYSEEAVKFVDLFQSHFNKDEPYNGKTKAI